MESLAQINRRKYLKAPTDEQLYTFIRELGVKPTAFERYYGIPKGLLRVMRYNKSKKLPAKYWHFIYERIVPTYGVTTQEPSEAVKKSVTESVNKENPHRENNVSDIGNFDHPLLNNLT